MHQYVHIEVNTVAKATAEAGCTTGVQLMPDLNGKFTTWDTVSNIQYFGKVLELRNRVPYNLDEIIDSFPSSGMKGMDTGGLTARLFHFVKSIITATGIRAGATTGTIADVKDAFTNGYTTATGTVALIFGQADVAFGTLK